MPCLDKFPKVVNEYSGIGFRACVPLMKPPRCGSSRLLRERQNILSVPTPQAMSDTIARQFRTASRAALPAGVAWEGLGEEIALARENAMEKPI